MMRKAIYPGSFDPITNGHLDVLSRALRLFDEVTIAIATNESKKHLFPMEERVVMVKSAISDLTDKERVRIGYFDGLLVDYALREKASAIVRGLRAVSDFEFEFQLALMNRSLKPEIETIFLMPKDSYTYLSSRIVKEIARLGGDVSKFVPLSVSQKLTDHFHPCSDFKI